jgi:hypothetical protein
MIAAHVRRLFSNLTIYRHLRRWLLMLCLGADFIKTSTGKEGVNATLPVSLVMVRAIRDYYHLTKQKVICNYFAIFVLMIYLYLLFLFIFLCLWDKDWSCTSQMHPCTYGCWIFFYNNRLPAISLLFFLVKKSPFKWAHTKIICPCSTRGLIQEI